MTKKKPRKRKRKLRVIQPGETRYWCLMDEADVIRMAYGKVPARIQQRLRGMLPARVTMTKSSMRAEEGSAGASSSRTASKEGVICEAE